MSESSSPSGGAPPTQRIWLFDRRNHWRNLYGRTLCAAGFVVRTWDRYLPYPPEDRLPDEEPSLVILACTLVEAEVLRLVERAAACGHRIVVLVSLQPQMAMRPLFLAGATDVVGSPSRLQLVKLVERTLARPPDHAPYEPLLATRVRR